MKMKFILPLALTLVLLLSSFAAADYEPPKFLRDITCDPVEIGIRALEDCNLAGNVDDPQAKYVNADLPEFYEQNKILASRDCYQRSNARLCNWDAEGTGDFQNIRIAGQWITFRDNPLLEQCLAIVDEYCDDFDTVKQIPMKTETGDIAQDRDYKATVEGGGLPDRRTTDDETGEAATPEEDMGDDMAGDDMGDDMMDDSTSTEESSASSSLIWWIIIIIVILLIVWWAVAGRKKDGSSKPKKAAPAKKAESKPSPKKASKKAKKKSKK